MKRMLSILFALSIALILPLSAFASTASTTQEIFNATPLTPRESTNPTIAKYVETVMAAIDPNGTLSTYEKAAAAYKWVSDNIEFAAKYTVTYDENYHYMEDATIYGFKNKKGPCEVDSAPLVYLLRYIGLNAQWAFGVSGEQYHLWTEVIVGGNTYVFDSYPNMEKSFQMYSGLVEPNVTTVGGFTHIGYFVSGGGANGGVTATNHGTMDKMRRLDGEADSFNSSMADASAAPAGKSYRISADYDGDSTNDYGWVIPDVTKIEKMEFAELSKVVAGMPQAARANMSALFGGVAEKTVNVYTIKRMTQMDNSGSSGAAITKLTLKDGKLIMSAENVDWSKEAGSSKDNMRLETLGNVSYYVHGKGDFYAINGEGYYILEIFPWVSERIYTDPQSQKYNQMKNEELYRDGYAVLHVVK